MKSLSQIVEILVTVVLLFFIPVIFFASEQEMLMQNYAQYQVIYFVDSVRNVGFLNRNMYELFLENLSRTNHVYKVELSIYEKYRNSGNEQGYLQGTYTDDILEKIYEEGERYTMHQGDFIAVKLSRMNDNKIEKILSLLGVLNSSECAIPIQYGGMIRDECF